MKRRKLSFREWQEYVLKPRLWHIGFRCRGIRNAIKYKQYAYIREHIRAIFLVSIGK